MLRSSLLDELTVIPLGEGGSVVPYAARPTSRELWCPVCGAVLVDADFGDERAHRADHALERVDRVLDELLDAYLERATGAVSGAKGV